MIDCHMARETLQQPDLIRRNATRWTKAAAKALAVLGDRETLVLLGRGSSANACLFAAYLYGVRRGRHAIEFRPWITTQNTASARWEDANVFAYSASGQSTDISHSAAWLRARGARVLGITNSASSDSNLASVSDALLSLDVGREQAQTATKTFCAQLFATAALCDFPLDPAADQTATAMERVVESDAPARIAEFIQGGRTVAFVARGPALAAAKDAALKLQEAVGMHCHSWSAAEFMHGPVGAMTGADRVILFQDTSEPADSLDAVSTRLLARSTPHLMVAEMREAAAGARPHVLGDLAVRIALPEARWARSVVLAFLSQLVSLEIAGRLGINPDQPVGLDTVNMV